MIECMLLLQQTRVIVNVSQGWLFFVSHVGIFTQTRIQVK